MRANDILNGSRGMAWVNGQRLANVKGFEAKVTGEFDDVYLSGKLGSDAMYKGYKIEGTLRLYKTDSKIAKLVSDGFKTGNMPEITVITSLDHNQNGMEKIQLDEVTFTEFTLQSWETGASAEEEVPFKAGSYRYLEQI